jgi:hypothetical protein
MKSKGEYPPGDPRMQGKEKGAIRGSLFYGYRMPNSNGKWVEPGCWIGCADSPQCVGTQG